MFSIVQKIEKEKTINNMLTIALIGGDGAGKTTIAKKLEEGCPLPTKYLYMGINPQAGEFSLPTSRLIYTLKEIRHKKELKKTEDANVENISAHYLEYSKTARGPILTALRLLNRLMEAWYRQFVSIYFQLLGYNVVYDRHPVFDTAPLIKKSNKKINSRINDLNHWIIQHLFPKPKLTIYLEAPAKLLHARKGESTPDYLEQQRTTFLKQGEITANFIRVDATQPLKKVYDDVQQQILSFHRQNGDKD